ncbi:EpsG family protein [Ligilactobacillus saerimneri]|uniref:EpsG family protein n=1 Tax=Ligilactobacillus saerimneri TaxID=228229 RepID=UPI002430ADDA|nr:EpsG family protein [Ligilactobacillus saerimneri]
MSIYLVTFLLAISIIKFSELITNISIKKIIVIIAIVLPSILAGMRSINVGTDILYYGLPAYKMSFVSDLTSILNHYKMIGDNSTIFYTLWYYSSRIFQSLFGPQFVLEFLIELNVILSLIKYGRKTSKFRLWQGMAVYYFIFYSYSLNLMKQSLAMSMVLLIFQYFLMENKKIKYIVGVVLIGMAVHTSALIAILAVPLKLIWERQLQKRKSMIHFKATIFILPLVAIALYKQLIMIIAKVFPRYALYLSDAYSNGISIKGTLTQVLLLLSIYGVYLFIKMTITVKTQDVSFYESLYLLGVSLFNFSLIARNGYRIGLYFIYIGILMIPAVFNGGERKKELNYTIAKIIRSLTLLGILVVFWYVSFVMMGINQVIPYSFG